MKPVMVDAFCGAGGAAKGLQQAGYYVVGVDKDRQPNYCGDEFIQGDAIELLADPGFMAQFVAAHTSPPCHGYSTITPDPAKHPRLIGPVRERLQAWGGPWVIENVPGARWAMRGPLRLCGSAFGLGVRRHRLFESNTILLGPGCNHARTAPVGVYGDHPDERAYERPAGGSRGVKATSLEHASTAMEIDWMTWGEITQAIPPAYTRFIGEQLITHLSLVGSSEQETTT